MRQHVVPGHASITQARKRVENPSKLNEQILKFDQCMFQTDRYEKCCELLKGRKQVMRASRERAASPSTSGDPSGAGNLKKMCPSGQGPSPKTVPCTPPPFGESLQEDACTQKTRNPAGALADLLRSDLQLQMPRPPAGLAVASGEVQRNEAENLVDAYRKSSRLGRCPD